MEASRALDALGCSLGYISKYGDAVSAYTQAYLKGSDTWVRIPKWRWPPEWIGVYTDPVVKLVLALYGHPDAGGAWESHCDTKLQECGWEAVSAEWPGVYWHEKHKALLVVYVDDFKMAAKAEDHDKLWADIKSRITMDEETEEGVYLGCRNQRFIAKAGDLADILDKQPQYCPREKSSPGVAQGEPTIIAPDYDPERVVRGILSQMPEYVDKCIENYCNLTSTRYEDIKPAKTPFIDEAQDPSCFEAGTARCDLCGRGDKALLPSTKKIKGVKPVVTDPGELADISASCLMQIMYLARLARFDMLRCTGRLTSFMTK